MTPLDFAKRPHKWAWGGVGGEDCSTFVGSWFCARTGNDPAAPFRGTYDSREGAEAIIAAWGGIERLLGAHFEPLGARRVQKPADGDIGLVTATAGILGDVAEKSLPGISWGPLWIVMGPRGAMIKALPFAGIAWRVCDA